MSLALIAILLLLIATPGIALRSGYLLFPFSKRFAATTVADEIVWSIIPALVLHFFGILAVRALGYAVDFHYLGILLAGAHDDTETVHAFINLGIFQTQISAYFLSLILLAFCAGSLLRSLVLKMEWDRRWEALRFSNEWYYLLTGRNWGLKPGRDFGVVWISAALGEGDAGLIYSGVLDSYTLAPNGDVDSFWLKGAVKVPLSNPDADPMRIPGRALVLPYRNVRNLNVLFIPLPTDEQARTGDTPVHPASASSRRRLWWRTSRRTLTEIN